MTAQDVGDYHRNLNIVVCVFEPLCTLVIRLQKILLELTTTDEASCEYFNYYIYMYLHVAQEQTFL